MAFKRIRRFFSRFKTKRTSIEIAHRIEMLEAELAEVNKAIGEKHEPIPPHLKEYPAMPPAIRSSPIARMIPFPLIERRNRLLRELGKLKKLQKNK